MLQGVKALKITAGVLFYLLDRYGEMQHICHGADRMVLRRSEHFRSQMETEAGVLYIYADKKGVLLFCSEKSRKTSSVLMNAFKETDNSVSSLWIPYGILGEGQEKNQHVADQVSEYISQVWNYFTQIQNEILELIISQQNIEEIMEKVRGLLRRPFIIVDRDMLSLYQHPDVAVLMQAELGENYQEEIVEELVLAKEFHEVAKKREPFYYWMKNIPQGSYCINIVVDGYYYARLVVYLEQGEEALPSGAEQLSEYLSTVIIQMIRGGTMQLHRSENDRLHLLCHNLIKGLLPESNEIREAVASYHWEPYHSYQVMCLEPYNATGWDTQIENTMPIMTRKLEQTWQNSCAVFSGKRILWILNLSLSEGEGEENSHERSQKLLILLRENVFRAGASSTFHDICLASSAMKEAEAALETGTRKDPSYWYYRFDDYRMTYMINAIKEKGIDPVLLIHPAIPILLEHDKTHESELSNTLQMFLEKRQNVTQSAEALFVHRTTLFRRLNQIRELTALDFEDTDTMLELQLSYRILKEQ